MWGEGDQCEGNCQCSRLITDSFKINSGSNASKRRHEEAVAKNFKFKIRPQHLNFDHHVSPANSPKSTENRISPFKRYDSPLAAAVKSPIESRRIMGDITNSPFNSPIARKRMVDISNSPLATALKHSPQIERTLSDISIVSPITTRNVQIANRKMNSNKISKIFEERNMFRMNKENCLDGEAFGNLDENIADDYVAHSPMKSPMCSWTLAQVSSTPTLDTPSKHDTTSRDSGYVNSTEKHYTNYNLEYSDTMELEQSFLPEREDSIAIEDNMEQMDHIGDDFQSLHDLETELQADNFDQCSKYEIISTDSPYIISRGSAGKVTAKNFHFGAPLADTETSTSFNKPLNRILNFDDSPIRTKAMIKKSLKFSDSPKRLDAKNLSPSKVSPTTGFKFNMKSNLSKALKFSDSPSTSLDSRNSLYTASPAKSTGSKSSLKSAQSLESGFISELEEALDIEELSTSPKIQNFNKLMSGTIKTDFKRSMSQPARAKSLFSTIIESPLKRPLTPDDDEVQQKRMKEAKVRPVLQRAVSDNAACIVNAMASSSLDSDLIGDFSVPFALPLTVGRHTDLKSISSDTLATLLRGKYDHSISQYQVIDCRYPYEFEGGHIIGAQNLYTPDHVLRLMDAPRQPTGLKRKILVFHCEFSMERGPKLYRFLRSSDRAKNKEDYPSLNYPEVYLLHDGYKSFYASHPELCTPSGYTAMLDPQYRENLKILRSNSLKRYHSEGGRKKLMW